MKDYLLELGMEEIPARFMEGLIKDFKTKFEKALQKQNLANAGIDVYGSYRRIAVQIKQLPEKQEDVTVSQKGPAANIAISESGDYLPPAVGFAKRMGIDVSEIQTIDEGGKKYLFATKTNKGQETKSILPGLVDDVVSQINLPIAMKWGRVERMFVRPIHWIVSLLDTEVVPLTMFEIEAGNLSYGHRFLTNNDNPETIASGAPVVIPSVESYKNELKKHYVIVDQKERKDKINTDLQAELGYSDYDQELLEEVTYLVEYPTLVRGHFSSSYLDIPQEVLIQCMKKNQKYFPVLDNKKLTEEFVVIADSVTDKSRQNIIKGNESVLIARLEDSKFFWEEDTKKPLSSFVDGLNKVVFQKNLGSIYDKKERLKELSQYLMKTLNISNENDAVLRTAELCKSDLITQMVYELPVLQGTMGKIYAEKNGESSLVANGIFDHYLPRFSGDDLPESITGIVVGLADRMDTLVACYTNNLLPTGSQDPWGIRRLISGIFQILFGNRYNLNILDFMNEANRILGKENKNKDKLVKMLAQRMKNFLMEQRIAYDTVDAILGYSLQNLVKAYDFGGFIDDFRKERPKEFKHLAETAVRVNRLAKKATSDTVDPAAFIEEEEKTTYAQFQEVAQITESALETNDYAKAIYALVSFCDQISLYFDKIMVMHKEAAVKTNRLAFLKTLDKMFSEFADFEKFVITAD